MPDGSHSPRNGFTLIELLVAVSILLILVMIAVQFFSKAQSVWATGSRIVEASMKGRAVADHVAQELGGAVWTDDASFSIDTPHEVKFQVLSECTSAWQRVVIRDEEFKFDPAGGVNAGVLKFSSGANSLEDICPGLQDVSFTPVAAATGLPLYVNVNVTVLSDDGKVTNVYQSRASFPNRDRYRF